MSDEFREPQITRFRCTPATPITNTNISLWRRHQSPNERTIFARIPYVLRTECQWTSIPKESNMYRYFLLWQEAGFFGRIWTKGNGYILQHLWFQGTALGRRSRQLVSQSLQSGSKRRTRLSGGYSCSSLRSSSGEKLSMHTHDNYSWIGSKFQATRP